MKIKRLYFVKNMFNNDRHIHNAFACRLLWKILKTKQILQNHFAGLLRLKTISPFINSSPTLKAQRGQVLFMALNSLQNET